MAALLNATLASAMMQMASPIPVIALIIVLSLHKGREVASCSRAASC